MIRAPAKAFYVALATAVGGVDRVKSNPMLGMVRLELAGGQLELLATDLDTHVIVTLDAEGEAAPFLLDGQRLLAIAAQVKDRGDIVIEPAGDSGKSVLVKAGRSRFTMEALGAEGFHWLSPPKNPSVFDAEAAKFLRLMTALEPAIWTDLKSRQYLGGIHLEPGSVADPRDADQLVAVATDGHKFYARSMAVDGMPKDWQPITVPRSTCGRMVRVCGDAKTLTLAISPEKIAITAGRTTYLSKLVAGQFPDWRRVVPNRPATHAYDTKGLIGAVEVAAAVSTGENGGKSVRLGFGEEETTLETRDFTNPGFTGQDACRHVVLGAAGAPEVHVNAEYLVRMLSNLDAETAEISCGATPGDPIVIKGAALTDRAICIMPMRG